jgi:hypothetical protein
MLMAETTDSPIHVDMDVVVLTVIAALGLPSLIYKLLLRHGQRSNAAVDYEKTAGEFSRAVWCP